MDKKKEADKIRDKANILLAEEELNEEKIDDVLKLLKQVLKLRKDIEDEEGMAIDCGTMGNIYGAICEFEKALVYYEKALKLFEKKGDENGRIITYGNMLIIYENQRKTYNVVECALKIKEIASNLGIMPIPIATMPSS